MKAARSVKIAALAALLIGVTGAQAADQNLWTGIYGGLQGVWVDGSKAGDLVYDDGTATNYDFFWGATNEREVELSGWMGGAVLGYNHQLGVFVIGAETDILFGALEDKSDFDTDPTTIAAGYNWEIETRLNMLATATAKLGFAMGPVMVYGKGGVAYATVDSHETVRADYRQGFTPTAITAKAEASDTHIGFVYGVGAEWMMRKGLSLKVEWNHINLGDQDTAFKGTAYPDKPACAGPISSSCSFLHTTDSFGGDLEFDLLKVGLNYQFGAGMGALE